MDFSPGIRVLRRHWLAILVVSLLAMAGAYASSFLVSPTYSATARVLVRAREVRYLNTTGQDLSNQPGVIDSVMAKALTQTSSGLIRSRAIAEQVVRELHLDQPRPQDMSLLSQARRAFKHVYKVTLAYIRYGFYAEPPAYEGAVSWVQSGVSAQPVKDSYLIEITGKADDPELSAAMTNSATRAFLDASRARVKEEADNYRSFLKAEMDDAWARVQQAEQAVRTYKEDQSITDLSEQRRLAAAGLDAARRELKATEARLEDAKARLDSFKRSLDGVAKTDVSTVEVNATTSTSSPQTNTTTTIADVPASTSTIEAGRSKTVTKTQPTTSTTTVESTTDQSSDSSSSERRKSVSPNRVYQDTQSNVLATEAEIAGLQARYDALAAALDEQSKASSALPGQDAQLSTLGLQLSAATNAYTSLRNAYESASVNAAEQAQEVSVVDEATAPLYPEKPWRWLFGVVGLLVGLVGGSGLAYLIEATRLGRARFRYGRAWSSPAVPAVPALASSVGRGAAESPGGLAGPSPA